MKFSSPLDLIGNTPLLEISSFFDWSEKKKIKIWMKMERFNLGGSIKDRIALNMINNAESRGLIQPGGHIIEPTSGNTGVGLAIVGKQKGYKVTIVMPESMSIERRALIQLYGAHLVLTPKEEGMKGAIAKAQELSQQQKNSWIPMQFENMANPESHLQTSKEILDDLQENIDYLITGVGTGGHITGCGKALKKRIPSLEVYAVEPETSALLSGEQPGPHTIQGIGAGFIPQVMDTSILNGVIKVNSEDSLDYAKKFTTQMGVSVGISTGATLQAIERHCDHLQKGSTVLCFNYDTGERYLSLMSDQM